MLRRNKTRVVVVSDLHAGSTVAPWADAVPLEDGGKYQCNKYQYWLNRCWAVAVGEIKALKPDVLVCNGDVVQGAHARDGQLVTNKTEIQAESAVEQLAPICDVAKRKYFIRGTEWHEGKAGEWVEHLAKELGGEMDSNTGRNTWWELFLDLGGNYVVHFAHHISVSNIPMYEASAPLRDLLILNSELYRFYNSSPNVRAIVRSHRHRCVKIEVPPDLVALTTPGWQLKNAFVHKKSASTLPQIGYAWLDWDGKELTPHKRTFDLPPVHVEKAK